MVTKYDLVSFLFFVFCFWGVSIVMTRISIPVIGSCLTSANIYIFHTCQPIQFTSIKYKNHFFFLNIWPYWKTDTGKHSFHEILLLF